MASIIKDKLHRCFCGHIRSREERKEAERQLATIMEIITPFLEQCVETGDWESWEEFKYWFPLFLKASSLREHGYTAECIGEGESLASLPHEKLLERCAGKVAGT